MRIYLLESLHLLIDYILVDRISTLVPAGIRRAFGAEGKGGDINRRVARREDLDAAALLQGVTLAALSWFALVAVSLFATFALLLVCKAIVNVGMVHSPWFLMPLAAISILAMAVFEYIISSMRATAIRNHIARQGRRKEGVKITRQSAPYPKAYDFLLSAGAAGALFVGIAAGVVFG